MSDDSKGSECVVLLNMYFQFDHESFSQQDKKFETMINRSRDHILSILSICNLNITGFKLEKGFFKKKPTCVYM